MTTVISNSGIEKLSVCDAMKEMVLFYIGRRCDFFKIDLDIVLKVTNHLLRTLSVLFLY